ncbi:MAG: CDP-glucose 4,6-dehydratase [Terracidiphilus sp.]
MNWQGKRVLITGHTGFKGGWLSVNLASQRASLFGLALQPPSDSGLFRTARIESIMDSRLVDVRDYPALLKAFEEIKPEVVFHLAAQPLVFRSYAQPRETIETNTMGTTNILEAVRRTGSTRVVVVITSDKCYENHESSSGYKETDRLGGHDPYSASKVAAEMVAAAYRSSFFPPQEFSQHGVALATVRAGNVIGGGDWSQDRIIPDMVRAFSSNRPVAIRNPRAVRPWQFVLEPVGGYVMLAERLWDDHGKFASSWNFGPEPSDAISVGEIVKTFAEFWGEGASWDFDSTPQPHETGMLLLDCSKAASELGWTPRLNIRQALSMTADWYKEFLRGTNMLRFTNHQIDAYREIRGSVSA